MDSFDIGCPIDAVDGSTAAFKKFELWFDFGFVPGESLLNGILGVVASPSLYESLDTLFLGEFE